MELAGVKGYYLTDFLNETRRSGKSILPRKDYLNESSPEEGDLIKYELLQYDILFGRKFGLDLQRIKVEPSSSYRLGLGDPKIKSAEPAKYKGKNALLLKGDYFTSGSQVYINGEAADYTFIDSGTVYAFIPENKNVKTLQMKIFDSENVLLSSSNEYTVK
ncbi:IPT/TIG domain-containing protein [Cytobacillus firmus]|uniref:IPT/TIG domain-containing protein n=1 Tax=Cytobacillus firmus TaxID=1399 RepID=UPI0021863924|nr:IPT/TIG domain-containing protein [Cytobacillus firmus]URM33427.1 IPT/TIG domain-containing protein [Cytobacillus firmus]